MQRLQIDSVDRYFLMTQFDKKYCAAMVIIRKRSSKMLCSHDSCFLCLDVVWLVVATPLRTRISQVTLLSNLNYSYFLWIIYVDRNMKLVLPTHWGVTFETNPPAHFLFHSLCELMQAMVPVSLADQFSTVTILALDMPQLKLKVVIGYLACFPCLEKLHVKVLLANSFVHFCCQISSLNSCLIYCFQF